MSIRGLIVMVAMSVMMAGSQCIASAQLRLISQDKLQTVNNPRLSSDSSFLKFETTSIEAESMNEDDAPKTFIYRFTNVGSDTLRIRRIVSSCSCAQATCVVSELAPGTHSEISVRYNPKGHPGKFERKVFIYTQEGNDPAAILTLKVDVSKGADLAGDWPVQLGLIRLRNDEVTVVQGVKSVERLSFINLSGKPLKLECENAFLPECLTVVSDPETVSEGEEGQIVISYDPAKSGAREVMKVILKGLGLPPSRSTITVNLKSR